MTQVKTVLRSAAGLLLALVLLSGCDKDSGYTLKYSHNLHVKENGMACKDCHGKMADGKFTLPTHAACKECHGDWLDSKVVSTNTCGKCHQVKELAELAPAATATNAPEVAGHSLFVHTAALANRCADCHGAFLEKGLNHVPAMTHEVKVGIREKAHKWGLDCTTCHTAMDRKNPPPSHQENWTKLHGKMGQQPDNTCSVCHPQSVCRACHEVTKPQSHNNMWRLKTHGSQAAFDREKCFVCHRQDSCAACHANSTPQSHNAGWQHNHCYNCHAGAPAQNACAACHQGGNSVKNPGHVSLWTGPLAFHNSAPVDGCTNCHFPGGLARPRPGAAPKPHGP